MEDFVFLGSIDWLTGFEISKKIKQLFDFTNLEWLWVDLNHRHQHYECCALTN